MRALLQQALEFTEFLWRDVSLNDYASNKLDVLMEALRAELAKPEQEPVAGPSGDYLKDFEEGQWWVNELDAMARSITSSSDQKRAVAVVHNLLATIAAQPAQEPLTDEYIDQHIGADEGDREAVTAIVREVEAAHGIGGKA